MESENKPEKDCQAEETKKDKVAMMCWENSEVSLVEEPNKKTDNQEGRADDEMEKPKDEEDHVNSRLQTGNRLKLSIKEFSWGIEDNASTLNTQEATQ